MRRRRPGVAQSRCSRARSGQRRPGGYARGNATRGAGAGGRDRHLGEALQFFFDDTPNVPTPLTRVVFPMGIVDTWYTPERTPACLWG